MKSCLGLLFTMMVLTLVVGGGGLIWYLSYTAEFSRNTAGATTAPAKAPLQVPPKARPVKIPGTR